MNLKNNMYLCLNHLLFIIDIKHLYYIFINSRTNMPGGLMQLLTVGAQDQYLTVSPEKSYFKQVYKRPTNFSTQSVKTTFSSTPLVNPSSRVQYKCQVPRVGDMLGTVYLSLTLPDIFVANTQQIVNGKPVGQPIFRWIPKLGNYLVYTYSLIGDTQLLDQRWGEMDEVYTSLAIPTDKQKGLANMLGDLPSFQNPESATPYITLKNNRITYSKFPYSTSSATPSISGRQIYIPLNFWFTKSPDLYLPLVALQYQTININIEMRMLEELFQLYDPINNIYVSPATYRNLYDSWTIADYLQYNPNTTSIGNNGNNSLDLSPYLECNYIFLDTPERTFIATNSFDCLVENVYRTEVSGITNVYTIDLPISNPVKEIVWITRRSDIFNYNDWANYTATIPENLNNSVLNTAKFIWNGIDRFDEKNAEYFNLIQPYEYHTNTPRQGIYSFSFALYPEKTEPSGSYNASVIDKSQLYLTLNKYSATTNPSINGPDQTEYTVIVYSIYYNIFRVMSGTGAMVFAN